MNGRKVNLAFLISVLLYIGCVFALPLLLPRLFSNLVVNNLICETVMVAPGLLFMLISKEKLSGFLHFKRMKPLTVLMIVPFTVFSMSVITLVNLLSQFFVENTSAAMMENYQVAEMPFFQVLFSVGIFAPFCEELACRGIFYRGYRKSGSAFYAMLLSALLFALMHMNINQAMYAFVMGIISVLLVEATGSLWSSVLYHGLINSSQIVLMYGMLRANPSAYSEAASALDTDMLVYALAGYLVITAVSLPIAWAILVWMSGHEGRRGVLLELWRERKSAGRRAAPPESREERMAAPEGQAQQSVTEKKKDKLVTVPLLLSLILCGAVMIFTAIAQWLIKLVVDGLGW